MTMTPEVRADMRHIRDAKAVRVAIYDLGILIGVLFFAQNYDMFFGEWPASIAKRFAYGAAIGVWVAAVVQRYRDWKSIERIEEMVSASDLEERLDRLD